MRLRSFFIASLIVLSSCQEKNTSELILNENFEGDSLDKSVWNVVTGDGCPDLCGWGNNERQVYSKDHVDIKDNQLIITADLQDSTYYSGRINTKSKFSFKYGSLEVKAKLPEGQGLWPAIWMLGNNIDEVGWPASGEIDVMEYVGKNPGEIHTSLHTPDSYGNTVNTKITSKENIEDDFHIYKAEWNKDSIQFYIDGEKVYTFAPENKTDEVWPFDQKFYLLLNMAIGGNFGGPEVDDSIFPQKFIIDYVKVYSNTN